MATTINRILKYKKKFKTKRKVKTRFYFKNKKTVKHFFYIYATLQMPILKKDESCTTMQQNP